MPVVEVAMVLLLLTIEINWTGPPITLSGDMYGVKNEVDFVHTCSVTANAFRVVYLKDPPPPSEIIPCFLLVNVLESDRFRGSGSCVL